MKYPRTYHFEWSKGATNDDKISKDVSYLINKNIVITDKCDGSNTCLESNACFARTHSGPPTHSSFDNFKDLHASIKHKIPNDIQLFGENCYALHSIVYTELPGYFLLFNVRNKSTMIWASWEEVEMWAGEIGVPTVPLLFKGQISSKKELKSLVESFMIEPSQCGGIREGVVVRVAEEFPNEDFSKAIMKSVRANHVITNDHWIHQGIIKNKLKS